MRCSDQSDQDYLDRTGLISEYHREVTPYRTFMPTADCRSIKDGDAVPLAVRGVAVSSPNAGFLHGKSWLAWLAIVVAVAWALNWVLLCLFSPSGVWVRREFREDPLKNPLRVTAIDGFRLTANGTVFTIGGVVPCYDREAKAVLPIFLRAATAQGIEIDGDVELPNGVAVRCEPRFWHGCGNDPVTAHFEQHNLNELLIAFGLAKLSPAVRELDTPMALRLRAAERYAARINRSERLRRLCSETGLNMSDFILIRSVIAGFVYEMKKRAGRSS